MVNNLVNNGCVDELPQHCLAPVCVCVCTLLTSHSTAMHWHGVRQLNSNIADGVGGITECPHPARAQQDVLLPRDPVRDIMV